MARPPSETAESPACACPECGSELVLHQPDPELPDRLLGTCGDCKAWLLIDAASGRMVRLSVEGLG